MISVNGGSRHIPDWWIKDLHDIDPTYYVVYSQIYDYFTITKKVRYLYEDGGKMEHVEREVPLAVFRDLNDRALDNLRQRKAIGRKFERENNPTAYLDWIKSERKEARRKQRELALEMKAEGFMKIHQAETRTGFFNTA